MIRYYIDIFVEGLRKTVKSLSHHSLSLGQVLNSRPPEYEAGVLTTRPRRSAGGLRKTTKICSQDYQGPRTLDVRRSVLDIKFHHLGLPPFCVRICE
jgi:hypothetical protein